MIEGVLLRDLLIDDVEDRYNWMLDREVTKYLNVPSKYPPFTIEETRTWVKSCIDGSNGYIQKAIIVSNRHIGWIDLKNFDRANRNAELGIAIGNKDYWGKGVGAEAIKCMIQLGFDEYELHKIWLRVDSDNTSAINCYRKVGFTSEGTLRQDRLRDGQYIDRLRMSILQDDFVSNS
jgi:RimJ/RimL family protein N-acetyltransferase